MLIVVDFLHDVQRFAQHSLLRMLANSRPFFADPSNPNLITI